MRCRTLLVVPFLLSSQFCVSQHSAGIGLSPLRSHDSTVVVEDDYIGTYDCAHNSGRPKVYVEAIVTPDDGSYVPIAVESVSALGDSIVYPDLARRAGLEGRVILRASIDRAGVPQNVEVIRSDAGIFNEPAIEGIRRWRFRSTEKVGEIVVPVSFVLYRQRNPTVQKIVVDRTECYGFGGRPSFKITLHPDGVVLYEGHAEVDKIGMWSGQLPQRCLSSIVSLLYFSKFFSTAENIRSNSTDGCFITISVTTEYRTKSVRTDCYEPIWAIGDYVERVVNDLTMEKKQ